MPSRKDCLDDIARKTGRKREEVKDPLDEILEGADGYEQAGIAQDEAYTSVPATKCWQQTPSAALIRRATIMDCARKLRGASIKRGCGDRESSRARLSKSQAVIGSAGDRGEPRRRQRAVLQRPFSVDAHTWRSAGDRGGLQGSRDAGLVKISRPARSRPSGSTSYLSSTAVSSASPASPRTPRRWTVAKTIRKWQRQTHVGMLNREGAWVRSYSGYVTRTSHDSFKYPEVPASPNG